MTCTTLHGVRTVSPFTEIQTDSVLPRRTHYRKSSSQLWKLYWEAGPYYERVAEALECAHSYVIFVGWQIDSRVELKLDRHEGFRDLVLRACRENPNLHVYFLMWDYAYFYVFERELLQGLVWDNIHERVHFVFDNRHPYGGSHHEKLVVVDGELAFVGGVDICNDRWDMPGHAYDDPTRSLRHDGEEHSPYHDVIVELRGEVAADLVDYVRDRWEGLSSIPFPARPRRVLGEGEGRYPVLMSRTRAHVGVERPLLVRESEFLFRELIRSAQRQLVIENQYYWSEAMNDELIRLLRARAGTDFRLFIVVPSHQGGSFAFRMMGHQQTLLLDRLTQVAAETGTRMVLGCPFARSPDGRSEKSIYVHSKVLVVDDRFLAIGSSNINNRGFRLDTEINLTLVGETDDVRNEIAEQSRRIVGHWGPQAYSAFHGIPVEVGTDEVPQEVRHLYLKPYHAAWDAYFATLEGKLAQKVSLAKFFDPPLPLGYVFKTRIAVGNSVRLRRVLPLFCWGVFSLTLGLALLGADALTGLLPDPASWQLPTQTGELGAAVALAFVLSLAWLVPVPTLLTSACLGLVLGAKPAAVLAASSLLVAALVGYVFSRIFPTISQKSFRKFTPSWLRETLGKRRLPVVFHVVCNPLFSFQSKVGYQGILSIPLRWFVPAAAMLALMNAAAAYGAGWLATAVMVQNLRALFVSLYLLAAVMIMVLRVSR